MGGGFYDRSFAFKKDKQIKPILMGFSYDFQEVDALQAEDWDVPLDFIATEKSLRKF
jgi:5-formyltetrahydrofolate cyclo-ligase